MVFYATIRKGIKWYRKLGIQLLLGISVVNASTVYEIATRKNINIGIFRQLLGLSENSKNPCLVFIMQIKDVEWTEQRHERI